MGDKLVEIIDVVSEKQAHQEDESCSKNWNNT